MLPQFSSWFKTLEFEKTNCLITIIFCSLPCVFLRIYSASFIIMGSSCTKRTAAPNEPHTDIKVKRELQQGRLCCIGPSDAIFRQFDSPAVQFMNAANIIERFTIMRIREEQNLNVIFVEHFVRIELEHFLSMRVHGSNIFMIPAFKFFEMFDYLIMIYCQTHSVIIRF